MNKITVQKVVMFHNHLGSDTSLIRNFRHSTTKQNKKKVICVNASGIPPAVQQVLGLGGTYLGWGVPTFARGVPTLAGGTHLGQDGVLPWCEQTENFAFPHPSDAGSKNVSTKCFTFSFPPPRYLQGLKRRHTLMFSECDTSKHVECSTSQSSLHVSSHDDLTSKPSGLSQSWPLIVDIVVNVMNNVDLI